MEEVYDTNTRAIAASIDTLARKVQLQQKEEAVQSLRAALPQVVSAVSSRAVERSSAFAHSNVSTEHDANENSADAGIDYNGFADARSECEAAGYTEQARTLLSPSNFLRLPRDANGRVPLQALHELLDQHVNVREARLLFATYDADGDGRITTDELGNAILNEVIKTKTGSPWAVKFRHMESFKCIVTRKFLFQLDVRHSGKLLSLHRVAACPAVEELHELLLDQLVYPHENWFFPRAAQQVRQAFCRIDGDNDGYVSATDLAMLGRDINPPPYLGCIMLTSSFAEHLMQEHGIACGKRGTGSMYLSFNGFLDFIIAYTSLSMPEAVQYFFSVLDLRKRGYLTRDDLLRFARTTAAAAAREHGSAVDPESVCDELMLLVRPSQTGCITKADIINANAGRIFVPYLIDSAAMSVLEAGGTL